jgi:hypothetical protein
MRWWTDLNLTRLGLLSGFLSFWLATPELIGEETLRHADERLNTMLQRSRTALVRTLRDNNLGLKQAVGTLAFWITLYLLYVNIDAWHRAGPAAPGVLLLLAGGGLGAWVLVGGLSLLLRVFANRQAWRRRTLIFGGVFFSLSWILQLLGTYAPRG